MLIVTSLVLARARQFLPLLASSNQDLLSRAATNPDAVNIENTDGQDQVIAMVGRCGKRRMDVH